MSAAALASFKWIHGAASCAESTDPLLQVYRYDEDTFILRISKCFSFEGNFLYLLFGRKRAILFDTGGPADPESSVQVLPLRQTIDNIISQWLEERGRKAIELVVAHTHGHEDHVFWDSQFEGRPKTTLVPSTLAAVKDFFGLPDWPEGQATFDLGERPLTNDPIPGHEASHIASYDERTKILLTGDTLYPGQLTVRSWPDFRSSAARLAAFAEEHEVSLVLGNHIEMRKTPGEVYPLPTTYQPEEHALPLTARHIAELHAASEALGESPRFDVHDEFLIDPL
jgi:glyoxylase-like metal-dependent hydrolase (beta-lactamase superfamily II)